MITRKQWNKYCDTIDQILYDGKLDVLIRGRKVIKVEYNLDGSNTPPKVITEDMFRQARIEYIFPDSFNYVKSSRLLYEKTQVYEKVQVRTDPNNCIDTDLTEFYKKN